jgi:hypothetical protein
MMVSGIANSQNRSCVNAVLLHRKFEIGFSFEQSIYLVILAIGW